MKKQVIKMFLIGCITSVGITSCNNSPQAKEEKVENAKENLADAKDNLAKAITDSTNDYNNYKSEMETKLADNDRQIADLKAAMKKEKKTTREKYEKLLAEIDERNEKLKNRMKENNETAKEKWADFKLGFNKDMDALGKSISDLAQKNMNKSKNNN